MKNHDAICREEDSLWRKSDGSFSHHEVEAARQEAEEIAKNRQQLDSNRQSDLQSAERESSLRTGGECNSVRPRLNKQDIRQGIRLKIILDKPRSLEPWKEDTF